jgi:hypothetical protein
LNDYFIGAIKQHQERGRRLIERIPPDLPREFHVLVQKCNDELTRLLDHLRELLEDPLMKLPDYQSERLRQFRRIVEHMSLLETTAVAALERHNQDDIFLNGLIEIIKAETRYPLLPPVVTSLSQQYFHIFPNLNLLFVPLSEGDFLLHLPDLYHELAHPLITERYNPRVKPFQAAISTALDIVLGYIGDERSKEERRGIHAPKRIGFYLYLWQKCWLEWLIEFFCDLYGICAIGPAFAWSHIYLCAKFSNDPYDVPTMSLLSHPADDARMKAMLYALTMLGFKDEANDIKVKWEELLTISGAKATPEYRRCFPDSLIQRIAEEAVAGVNSIGCCVAGPNTGTPIYTLLNEAWKEFWRDPVRYIAWEREAVKGIRGLTMKQTS